MPDQRGHGQSEGDYVGWGFDERLDLVGCRGEAQQSDRFLFHTEASSHLLFFNILPGQAQRHFARFFNFPSARRTGPAPPAWSCFTPFLYFFRAWGGITRL